MCMACQAEDWQQMHSIQKPLNLRSDGRYQGAAPWEFTSPCIPCLQARYAAGVKEILRRSFAGEELNPTDVIVAVRPYSGS